MSDIDPTTIADRYGARSAGPSRWAKVAMVVALVGAVAVVAWFAAAQHARSPVTADVVSFRVTSAEEIEVDFQVSMPAGRTAVCTVGALSATYAQVGTLQAPVGPSETATTHYTVTVRTTQQADAAVIEGCTSD